MPWCGGAEVQTRDEHGMRASILISFAGMKQRFTTRNTHVSRPHRSAAGGRPFSSLVGHWEFQPLAEDACKVLFTMEYAFSNRALEMVVGPVFNRIATSFIDSFTKRAQAKYMANEDIGVSVCHALPDQIGRGCCACRPARRRPRPSRPAGSPPIFPATTPGRQAWACSGARSGRIRP